MFLSGPKSCWWPGAEQGRWLPQVNSEQSDAEADPSVEEGARVDSSDDETTGESVYFDARELQRPSMTLPDDLDGNAADGCVDKCVNICARNAVRYCLRWLLRFLLGSGSLSVGRVLGWPDL